MSGYLLAVGNPEKIRKVSSLFLSSETSIVQLSNTTSALLVSNSASLCLDGHFIQGFAIDMEKKKLIFADASVAESPCARSNLEGCYITGRVADKQYEVGTDFFGYTLMLYTSCQDIALVSDSFLSLLQVRQYLAEPVTPSEPEIRARQGRYTLQNQLLSKFTPVKEIRFARPGNRLSIRMDRFSISEIDSPLIPNKVKETASYSEVITQSAENLVALIAAFSEINCETTFDLSGGLDSRTCFAAMDMTPAPKHFLVRSNPDKHDEYRIAKEICHRSRNTVNLNAESNAPHFITQRDPMAQWAAANLGIYDPLHSAASFRTPYVPQFVVGGQGAEAIKGIYGWKRLSSIPRLDLKTARETRRALRGDGMPFREPWESEIHYVNYRNPIHGGRGFLSTDYIFRPLAQRRLLELAYSNENAHPAPGKYSPSIISDLLIKLSPELASVRFDDHRKNLSKGYIAERLTSIGGELVASTSTEPFQVVGNPRPPSHLSTSFIEIAKARGYSGAIDGENLTETLSSMGASQSEVRKVRTELQKFEGKRPPAAAKESLMAAKLLLQLEVQKASSSP